MSEQEAVNELKGAAVENIPEVLPDPAPLYMEIADHISRETPNLLPLHDLMKCLGAYMKLRDQFLLIRELADEKNAALRRIAVLMKEMESPNFLVDKK